MWKEFNELTNEEKELINVKRWCHLPDNSEETE